MRDTEMPSSADDVTTAMNDRMNDGEPPAIPGVSALARIDGGGFCSMYRGRATLTGRGVAVKVLPTRFDRNSRAEFDLERARLGRLAHVPAVLQVDEVGALPDGRPYLVSELCTESLADRIHRAERLSAAEIGALGHELAGALALVHDVDIVHGAVTPRNVLFRRSGQAVLSDIGLALRQTYPGDPADNGEFAAPETLRDGSVNARSDLYGLGATLYAGLTGQPPFPLRIGEHPSARILRVIGQPAPAVDAALAPPGLATLLAEMLATRPEDRPGDAAIVADRFAALAAPPAGHETIEPATDVPEKALEDVPENNAPEYVPTQTQTTENQAAQESTDWSGLLDDVLYDAPPAEQVPEPQPLQERPSGRRRRTIGFVGLGAAGLVLIVLVAVVAGRLANRSPETPKPTAVASATPGTSAVPAVRLGPARDHGRTVDLSWTGPATLNYAVVIAEPGQPTQVVLAHHARSFRVSVAPGRQYCFLIQATNGSRVIETDPRPIRGAVCRV